MCGCDSNRVYGQSRLANARHPGYVGMKPLRHDSWWPRCFHSLLPNSGKINVTKVLRIERETSANRRS